MSRPWPAKGGAVNAWRFVTIVALGLALVAACQTHPRQTQARAGPSPQATADSPVSMAALHRGQQAFLSYCAMCHGNSGNGDGDVAPIILKASGVTVARLNDRETLGRLGRSEIEQVIARGGVHTGRSNLMPAWGEKLEPSLITDIAMYVTTLADSSPAIPRETLARFLEAPAGVTTEGRTLFVHHCSACHGPYGRGDGSYGDQLFHAHQVRPRNLTDSTYMSSRTDRELFATISLGGGHFRKSVYMPAWTVTLSPAQIKSVVAYLREISLTATK